MDHFLSREIFFRKVDASAQHWKYQITRYKYPKKSQIKNSKPQKNLEFSIWILKFVCNLSLGYFVGVSTAVQWRMLVVVSNRTTAWSGKLYSDSKADCKRMDGSR
ncbi:MAG: hypothetical protein WAP55_01240 [Minisyncoccia bacterium]